MNMVFPNFVDKIPYIIGKLLCIIEQLFYAFLIGLSVAVIFLIVMAILDYFVHILVFLWKRASYLFWKIKWVR